MRALLAATALCCAIAVPSFGGTAMAAAPNGTFVDRFGTSFTFWLCGATGTDLCGVLKTLRGASATEANLIFVGKEVVQAVKSGPNEWKASLKAGSFSADATLTITSDDTIDIRGCRSIFCETVTYVRN